MALTVKLEGDAVPFLKRLSTRYTPKQVNELSAAVVADLVGKHIRELESSRPNKKGFPRSHFWNRSSESVNWDADSSSATVSVSKDGFRYQYFGGTINPVNARALTIPIHPRAYNHRAGEFKLAYVPSRGPGTTVGFLRAIDTGEWYYVLKSSVSKGPDHSVIPTEAQMARSITNAIARDMESL